VTPRIRRLGSVIVKLAMTMVARGDSDLVDAHLAFHLNAGVDAVIVVDPGSEKRTTEILESFAHDGYVRRVPTPEAGPEDAWLTELARLAVAEHGADWVIPSNTDEFWWPRGESLTDVLAVIPPRYSVVQALVRTFAGQRREGGFFAEDMTARTSLLGSGGPAGEPLQHMLRPVYRAEPNMEIDEDDWTLGRHRVPLRAWYPIEVFRFRASPGAVDDARLDDLLADGTLVVDTRLRDAFRRLRDEAGGFARPAAGTSHITLPVPTIVEDASYAVECAAVGEVDLVRLDQQIRELELRLAALEARFWPRVRRALRRLARRRR
jgi:hypothetical protein